MQQKLLEKRQCIFRFGEKAKNILQEAHGPLAHLKKQFKSINTYDYHNVDEEKKKPIIYFLRIEWFFI